MWAGTDGPYDYEPFLSGVTEFEQQLDVFSLDGVGALTQARVEVVLPSTDLAALQGDWYHVVASTVELSLIWEGQSLEDRLVVLDGGTIQGVEFGVLGQATSFTLEATPPVTSAAVGDDSRDVGTDFPSPLLDDTAVEMSDLEGSKYIHVYGNPDSVPAYKIGDDGAGNNRLLLCGHELARSGASYVVTIYEDGVSAGTFTATNASINGGSYSYVSHATNFRSADGAFTWKATYGGVAAADGYERAALNADGVIRRLLVDSGLRVDWRQTEPALAKLRDWRLGFFIDQEAPAIEVLRDRVLQYLPVVELNSGDGLWLHYCDPHHGPIEAHLVLGQDLLGRTGPMTISDVEAIRNGFTINYNQELFAGKLLSSLTLDESNSALCYFSEQLYGERADEVIDCDVIWDEATALRVLLARADRLALPRRILEYEVARDAYWLDAGMVVSLTDPDYGIDAHRAVITSINRSMSPFRARLELIDRTPFSRDT